jgi:hypothetical protein
MSEAYSKISQRIMDEDHELVGVSYRKLDCGCMQFCGISRMGRTVACRYHLSGQPPTRNLEQLVCLKCRKDTDFAVERTVAQGIVWSAKAPPSQERLQIGRMVLGDDYQL